MSEMDNNKKVEQENDESKDLNQETDVAETELDESKEINGETDQSEKDEEVSEEEKQIEELKNKLQQMKKENEENCRKYQRLKADFVNYRKRMTKEKTGIGLHAKIELVEELLTVIDNFERALKTEDEDNDYIQGVKMIYRQLVNVLKQEGLEVIKCEGETFDHKYHEAIMQVEDDEVESGIILEELQKGYIFNDKVIRPAMVKVAK
mgnify:CR=1 FL=1